MTIIMANLAKPQDCKMVVGIQAKLASRHLYASVVNVMF